MIKVTNLSFEYPQKELYKSVCFEINEGDHAVLIGSNGTGKSTLLSMMMNREDFLYDGKIEMADNMRIGYVSQYTVHEGEQGVFEYLSQPFVDLLAEADEVAMKMGEAEDMDAAYDAYEKIQNEIDAMDAYNYESNIKKQLAVADLDYLLEQRVDQISGGEYKLLSMIKTMMMRPHFLIMDEPDAFLDFANLISLSKLINDYAGTLLVVSHNRLLLGQCFNKILHLENGELQEFPGTFVEYNRSMLETKTLMLEQATKDEEWIAIQEKVVEQFRNTATMYSNAKLGAQVHARVSYLERLQARKAKNPFIENLNIELHFPEVEVTETDEVLFEMKDYSLTYDETLLTDVNFQVKAGDKVALVGANGTGKSSLLKDLIQILKETWNPKEIAYFSQIYEDEEQLSGGEKNIKLLREIGESEAKLLLLDEPTSHLDTYAQMALERAVNEYQGTVFMVSHDFYTVANCADRILLLDEGTLREMSGRAFRKRIYKKYFSSDIFEQEKKQKELEVRINTLLKNGNYKEAKNILGLEEE